MGYFGFGLESGFDGASDDSTSAISASADIRDEPSTAIGNVLRDSSLVVKSAYKYSAPKFSREVYREGGTRP